MLPVQLAMPLALLVGAAIAATTDPSRSETLPAVTQARADGQPEMRMLRISIEPGASLPWHRHTVPEAGYLLEGELRLETLEGTSRVMRPGDSIVGGSDVMRGGTAGPKGATVVVFYADTGGDPLTVSGA
ncbi:quercetin dioxygenase-like cupin family protein [Luteibacter jiangsuensis]|uniref:Quercetin dioxygenase-like cupin family protein n=1 Tax=Luteibacter jiangsuensis TaxID=637577 RepID=A0ABT9T2B7_9GAMM|nr:cupin domain-containing protein [Luteibacter jiangsuensis]MDQ0011419.1 quercetin dioxygenase-like cupin family protein [Luteibacter jiangsuensis]